MSVKLDTPYFFQIDNDYHKIHRHGWRQCCLTSNAMLASTMRTKFGVPNGLASLKPKVIHSLKIISQIWLVGMAIQFFMLIRLKP